MVVRSLALRLPPGSEIGAHDHPWPQLVYASRGVLSVTTATGAWVVTPERGVWVDHQVEHAITTSGEVWMRSLYFAPGRMTPPPSDPTPADRVVLTVTPLLRELVAEVVRLQFLDDRRPEHAHLAAVLGDQLHAASPVPHDLALPRDPRARAVADRVRAEPGSRDSLEVLAAGCGAAPRTIERLFLKETSLSFGRWRQRARLLHALCLLAEGRPVTEVSIEAGYDSPSAFIAMFKRTIGTTPGRYVAQTRGQAEPH